MIKREHYKDLGYKPFLFYVIFGVTADQLQVSASRHHVDGMPEGLEIAQVNRTEHGEYIDNFFTGTLGDILRNADAGLFEKCKAAENCVIIKGEVAKDDELDYMRNVIGIGKAFFEQGAAGILDMLTFSLYSDMEWTDRFFEKDVNAQNHVTIMISEENGRYWLHTRGVLEFGRPDISLYADKKEDVDEYKQIIDQMVFYSGQGVFFNGKFSLHTFSGNTYSVNSVFVDDFDNDDFNNAYCKVEVLGKK